MDITELERANDYVDSIKWRLETLQSRSRYSMKTGELKKLPTRLRRFSNGIPQDNVAFTLDILVKRAPYDGVMFNGEDDEGLKYRPTSTVIRKDKSLESDGGDATYTIIQDLILVDEPDAYATGESASCSNIVTAEYHWDEPDVAECPEAEQGISWQVASVSRDRDTDLFSFTIRKSVAITQHMDEQVTGCANDQTVTTETWDNVYGEPGAYKDNTGTPIRIPEPCTAVTGDTVAIDVSENPDCTFKIRAVRTTTKVVESSEYLRMRDRYKATIMDFTKNARIALSKSGVEYADGKVTRYETKLNQDGTYDNRVTTETERAVPQSTISRSIMPFQVKTERTDTNVAEAATDLMTGFRYGSYESTKTPGGLFVNKYVGIELIDMDMGVTCKDTLFQHDHQTERMVKEMPDISSFHVPAASGGLVQEVHVRLDGNGSIIETYAKNQEHSVQQSVYEYSVTPRSKRTSRTDTAMTAPATALLSGLYGSFKSTRTPGGLWTNEYVTFEPVIRAFGYSCRYDIYKHQDSTEESVAGSVIPAGSHISKASGGVIITQRYSIGDDGILVKRLDTEREIRVDDSTVETRTTPMYTLVRKVQTNVPSAAKELASGKYGSTKSEKTPGGLYVNETTTVTPNTKAVALVDCTQDQYKHEHTTEKAAASMMGEKTDVAAAKGGEVVHVTERLDDNGVVIHREQKTKELEVKESTKEIRQTPRGRIITITNTNVTNPEKEPASSDGVKSVKNTKTPGKLYVTEVQTFEPPKSPVDTGKSRTRTVFDEEHVDEQTTTDKNLNQYEKCVDKAAGGVINRTQARADDNGIVSVTKTKTTELPFDNANVSVSMTPRGKIVKKVHRHRNTKAETVERELTEKNVGQSIEAVTNPGGTIDRTETKVEPNKGFVEELSCEVTASKHTDVTSKVAGSATDGLGVSVEAKKGISVSERIKTGDDGIVVRETTKKTEVNREVSVRVHEDMNQAYQIVERLSDAENRGDPNHVKPDFFTNHDNPGEVGTATQIEKPTSFDTSGTPARATAAAERGPMSADLTENVTAKKIVTKGKFERGMQSVVDSELTDGGNFHTKEYKYVAKPQKWKDVIKTEKHISYKWTFRSLTQEQIDPLLQEVLTEAAKYDYGTFTVTPSVQRTLNEFGLYDGTVGFTANSPLYGSDRSHNQTEEDDHKADPIAKWWEKSMQVTPVSNSDPNSSSYKAATSWFQVRIVWTEYENGWGRGLENYKAFLQGNNNSSFWAGSRHNYDQNSRRFTYLMITNVRVRVFLVPGSKLPEVGGDLTKVFESDKVNDLGEKGEEGKLK